MLQVSRALAATKHMHGGSFTGRIKLFGLCATQCSPTTSARCFQRSFSSAVSRLNAAIPAEKPFYITTPIFYVNAAPHVGHLYSMVLADIIKRWHEAKGERAILCTGTDEHGMKVQQAAEAARLDTKVFCDRGSEIFKDLAKAANISNDHFVRTTDADHRDAVEFAWSLLEERGYIYLSKHEGWYSVSDEAFYPQSAVHLVVEPMTGKKMMASVETGKEVEWASEENYRFRLSAFKNQLLTAYHTNPQFIQPQSRRLDVIAAVQAGLEDLSISRPSTRLKWGIPVPKDESQTIYVWLDALINYITKAGYPWAPGAESAAGWPADVQVVGKDIVRFHCIYWPAFLLALDLPLPKQILTHAHWTLGREKMAKSTGNVVDPFFALDRYGVDVIRYYLAHDGPLKDDSSYSNEYINGRYKKDLQHGLGNLTGRVARSTLWRLSDCVDAQKDKSATFTDADTQAFGDHSGVMRNCVAAFTNAMDANNVGAAVKAIMHLVYKTNTFLQEMAPWEIKKLAKSTETGPVVAARQRARRTIYQCSESLRLVGILLLPVMPSKMHELLDMLGVDPRKRTVAYAEFGVDQAYGEARVPVSKGHGKILFPPIEEDA